MARNRIRANDRFIAAVCTDPATPASGDPVVVGQIPGVALVSEDAAGLTSIDTSGRYLLSVKGIDASAGSAVAVGDILYYVAADTPKLSKKATGVRFGYAMDPVVSGATTTIGVKVGY